MKRVKKPQPWVGFKETKKWLESQDKLPGEPKRQRYSFLDDDDCATHGRGRWTS